MSFFDDGGETRTRPAARPRRAIGQARASRTPDESQLLARRAIAAGAALVVIVVFAIAVKGCLDSRAKTALKSYNSDVSAIAAEAQSQVSQPLFQLLTHAQGKQALDVEVTATQYSRTAADEASRAQALSVPGEMVGAQRALLLALNFRSAALSKIAANVRSALGSQGADQAVGTLAGEMEVLLASDVIYAQRVVPLIGQALAAKGISGQLIAPSQFVPDLGWLSTQTITARLLGQGGGGSSSGPIKSGSHGHGLLGASVGGTALQGSPAVNQLSAAAAKTFDVKIANQGTNDESNVSVSVKIEGGSAPITGTTTIPSTKAGTVVDAMVTLSQTPPVGTNLKIVASVATVPGEKNTANNHQTFIAQFK
ncbi:MAG: CARDB domain-containing protein [Solirubrobacteraceae bacterium]